VARDPQTIQREIEETRDALAATLDKLAARTSPKTLAAKATTTAKTQLSTPVGMAAVGVAAGLLVMLVVKRFRH
jgi:hypothetical protein